ncbi:hypothetical protein [Geobacillus thermocatenulatus]|uniref:hypothetical protein n=1 Tax=Geobacillus thermocatenulatus TaxID=33938 RepID=UPI003CC6BDB3
MLSQVIVMIPLTILYEGSIWVARIGYRKAQRATEQEGMSEAERKTWRGKRARPGQTKGLSQKPQNRALGPASCFLFPYMIAAMRSMFWPPPVRITRRGSAF